MALIGADVRARILSQPDMILEDQDLMNALVAANERSMGGNIVDLRGIAMKRLEARLDRLEDTHRSVIAAAYDNLSGAARVHRAVLALLDPPDFGGFLRALDTVVPDILQVDCARLVLESHEAAEVPALQRLGSVLCVAEPGFVAAYAAGRPDRPARPVVLRQGRPANDRLYGEGAGWVESEALMRLDLGAGRLPAMLVLAAEDPHQFRPGKGTDLLTFFAGVFERTLRGWLA